MKFHEIIQTAFGWQNYHLYLFSVDDFLIVEQDPGMPFQVPVKNPKEEKIDPFFKKDETFIYEYDLGDSWRHEIVVEDIVTVDEELNHPVCLDGERHRPPEDVGGIFGYEQFLLIINDPAHEDYDNLLAWAEKDTGGRKFDPEYFYKGSKPEIDEDQMLKGVSK